MPHTKSPQSSQHAKAKKPLCIIDTCSLIYMDRVELAGKPLQKWLWQEFDVKYSEAISSELTPFKEKMGTQDNWKKHVWRFSNISNYERAIFSSHQIDV